MDTIKTLKLQKLISALIVTIGVLLTIYMISAESEPGVIPLLLIAVGTGWYFVTRYKIRSQHEQG